MASEYPIAATRLSKVPQHSRIQFSEPKEASIVFSSEFDSGNLKKVHRNSYDHYSIWTASDAEGTQNEGYPKSWFYFSVQGFNNRKVNFSIHRVHFLWAMIRKNNQYRPVYRERFKDQLNSQDAGNWKRLPHPIQSLAINADQELVLKFDYYFSRQLERVEFAFIYPYSHEECHNDIVKLHEQYSQDSEILFRQYELCRTHEGRSLDVVMISSHEGKEGFETLKIDKDLSLSEQKVVRFRQNKPIIFMSARVHPIETPSSYTMLGVIRFLLNKEDYRAHLLRKYFVFVLVPMLNPDGVSNGNCRMDSLNQNLNRYYKNPDPVKQPSCYAVTKLCEHYNKDKRLFMYLDLHAHPANKGNFIFGNAIFDYIEQVESHLFPKVLSQNCINFEFEQCNFSRKHMKAKDRNEDVSKEGCGRVVFYKDFGLTHSYTLECGYHCNTTDNTLNDQQGSNQIFVARFKNSEKGEMIFDGFEEQILFEQEHSQAHKNEKVAQRVQLNQEKKNPKGAYSFKAFQKTDCTLDDIRSEYYDREIAFYSQQTFYNLGRNICISILDVWNKNPYTRIESLGLQRKEIAEKQAKLNRFRKEQAGIKTKQKNIIELIETRCYAEWYKRNIFQPHATVDNSKKNIVRLTQKAKRNEKSMTTEGKVQTAVSANSHIFPQNYRMSRKSVMKEEKKPGPMGPQVEGLKVLIPTENGEQSSGSLGLRAHIDSKNQFKPLNLRIRNINLNNR